MKIRFGFVAVLAAFLFAGTGCANNKLQAERDSLLNQNKDLQQQLEAERTARQSAEAKATVKDAQLTAAPTMTEVPAAPGMGGSLDLSGGNVRGTGRNSGGARGNAGSTPVIAAKPATSKVTIPGNVLFDSGKTTLSAAATKTLDSIVATIKKSYTGDQLVVQGYTDSTPVKSKSPLASNEALATARATAVKKYLVKKGIPEADISVKAFGSSEPASTKNPALNRRVEVVVLKTK